MAFEPDPWLSDVLGRPSYLATGIPTRVVPARGPGFYTVRVGSENIAALKTWLRAGFRLVDVAVTMERRPDPASIARTCRVRPLAAGDLPSLRSWAGDAFACSRFHLDPGFDLRLAARVKRAWVEEILAGRRADRVWVGVLRGRVSGFLARRIVRENRCRVGVLDLMAVRPTDRGRGIGAALIHSFVRHSAVDCDLLRVGTQAANSLSLRLYDRCGFVVTATHFVMHSHRQAGK
jgi:GNAT superfamily N-acetyltransferase